MAAPQEMQVVFITGCSKGGIGFELCEKFADAGCRVYASSRNVAKMEGFKHRGIRKLTVDVTKDEDVRQAIDFIVEEEGRIDMVVSNAGGLCIGPVIDITDDQAARAFDVNVLALLRITRAVVPHMVRRKQGSIVVIGSISGEFPTPFSGIYSASKSALHIMTETLSMELAPFNISTTLVKPGSVKSNIATNQKQSFLLPPNSLFKHYLDRIVARMFISQSPGAIPTDEFAKQVVDQVMKVQEDKRKLDGSGKWAMLRYIRGGRWAARFWFMSWLPRTWVLRTLAKRLMGPSGSH